MNRASSRSPIRTLLEPEQVARFFRRSTAPACSLRSQAVVLGCLLAGIFGVATLHADDATVISQRSRMFAPPAITIPRGSKLHIVNDDNITHHVYIDSPEMSFDSGEQAIGETADISFTRPGSFRVRCAIHPTMHLQVTVK